MNCKALFGFEKNQSLNWSWFKNDKLIKNSYHAKILIDNKLYHSSLELRNVSKIDSGVYKCVLKNDFGSTRRTMKLKVKGMFIKFLFKLNLTLCINQRF